MGCLKGKKKADPKAGNYLCTKCGGSHEKKKKCCKPEKVKD